MMFFASITTFTELEAGAPSMKVEEVDVDKNGDAAREHHSALAPTATAP
jgi:hypothetical protein